MRQASIMLLAAALIRCALPAACGGASQTRSTSAAAQIPTPHTASKAGAKALVDWPEFGLDPQRSGATEAQPASPRPTSAPSSGRR